VSAVEGHKLSPVWLASSITWSSVRFTKTSNFDSRTAPIVFEVSEKYQNWRLQSYAKLWISSFFEP
jgi:hypothetical protein